MIQLVALRRQRPLDRLREAAAEAEDVAAAAHVAPLDAADRAFEINIELRGEVMLEDAGD